VEEQICFDKPGDKGLLQVILKNLSSLCKCTFAAAHDLNRRRKELA
jgi:hypothetical protein